MALRLNALIFFSAVFQFFLVELAEATTFTEADPVFLSSPLFRAGNRALITSRTGNDQRPEFDIIFSSPYTDGIPHCAYGLKKYEGNILAIFRH